jgi:hypothetical protein
MLIFKAGIESTSVLGPPSPLPENQFNDRIDSHKELILWNRCLSKFKNSGSVHKARRGYNKKERRHLPGFAGEILRICGHLCVPKKTTDPSSLASFNQMLYVWASARSAIIPYALYYNHLFMSSVSGADPEGLFLRLRSRIQRSNKIPGLHLPF